MTMIPSNTRHNNRSIPLLAFWVVVVLAVWAPLLSPVRSWVTKPTNALPPPLPLKSIPLPVKLAGGLFLFGATSSAFQNEEDRALRQEILGLAENVLRTDPLISMELGLGIEAGGIFASSSSVHRAVVATDSAEGGASGIPAGSLSPLPSPSSTATTTIQVRQMGMEFQLNGGNSWAQARVSAIRYEMQDDSPVQLISLGVANMDASLNGGWAEVALPSLQAPPIVKYL